MSVPASWPVYNLTEDPGQCVRYDIHAVYLGRPGPDQDQDCPPGLIGRVDTISIGSVPQALPAAEATPVERGAGRGAGWGPAGDRRTPASAGRPAPAPGTIIQDPDLHELVLSMPTASPPVGATYGTGPGSTEQILATIHADGGARTRTGDSFRATRHPVIVDQAVTARAPAAAPARALAKTPARRKGAWPEVTTPPTGVPPGWLPPSDAPAPPEPAPPAPTATPRPTGPVLAGNPAPNPPSSPAAAVPGFDTCAAPSLPTMKAWRAKYAATAIYIGGQMMGCGQSNLSASWVQQAKAQGWELLPTFVGLQAPCDSFPGKINASQAASQGTAAASQAIAAASSYGLGPGSPIYYDMEAYNDTDSGCKTAVLTYLDAFDRQLEAQHYVPGLYSSAASGIVDVQAATTIAGHAMAKPQAVWFALWDNNANLNGTGYLTSAVWPLDSRSKQYQGNTVVEVGGISLDIDADLVASAVVRG